MLRSFCGVMGVLGAGTVEGKGDRQLQPCKTVTSVAMAGSRAGGERNQPLGVGLVVPREGCTPGERFAAYPTIELHRCGAMSRT